MDDKTTTTGDLFDQLNDFLINYDPALLDNDQDNFILYLDLTRNLSWDIPSALHCDHLDFDFPMHRPAILTDIDPWPAIDLHFKDIHGLDLTDSRINWSFDT